MVAAAAAAASLPVQAAPKLPGPLFDGLGSHHHEITTTSKQAQRYFDQGITFCFAFNHKEAIRSFRSVAQLDHSCAMAWWGIAYASGPHVNKPMFPEDNVEAWNALQRAIALQANASPKERAYITALSKRYEEKFAEDRLALDKAYAAGMRELVKHYPDDLDAQTMFAEAIMDTMPWDYWTKDRSPKPETEDVLAALRFVLARNPDHAGATHFYIHAVEAGPTPELGLPSADRLARLVPQAGHLVHMPSHIYMRVGQYHDATVANERAVKADQSYIRNCKAQGFYPGVYYPHNLHFLWYAQAYEGRSAEALKSADKVALYAMENYCGPKKVLEAPRFRHLPWITSARFGKWDDVLKVPQPAVTNDFLVDRVFWHFARGLAFAAKKDADAAGREYDRMHQLVFNDAAKKLDNPQFPASSLMVVADHWLAGKVAAARGGFTDAIAELEKAVAAEDALPYMEPAYWPFPSRPALGAVLLHAGQPEKAEQVFREDLKRWARNGWGLRGLEQSLRAQGRTQAADDVRRQLAETWKYADVELDLSWF